MLIELHGKTALVSASTGGIGLAVARGLAATGATIIVHGRSQDSVDKAIARISGDVRDAKLEGVAADLSDAAGCQRLLDGVAALGSVDILVNNFGIYEDADFFASDDTGWEKHWQSNVMAGVRLSRALMPGMVERGWGRVVFLSSESARNIPTDMLAYGVSKTALLSLSRGLAKLVSGSQVTVNAVLPGPTLSEGFKALMQEDVERTGKPLEEVARDFVKTERPTSILQRATTVDEVANLVVYVASKQASATTGAALRVDGGVVEDIV